MHYRHISTHWAIAAAFAFSCAGSSVKADKDGPEAVTLNFNWPEGSGAVVRKTLEQSKDVTETTSVVYTVAARDTNAGTEVTYTNPRDVEVPGLTPEELAPVTEMFRAIPSLTLRKGAVTAIGNTDRMRAILNQLAPIPADATPEARKMMEDARTDEFFLNATRGEWNSVTTIWHGKTLEIGRPLTGETYVQVLMIPKPVMTKVSMEFVERLPCPGDTERACVRVRYTSRPDAEAMATGLAWIAEDARRKGQSFVVERVERELFVELVTEPDTLVPHEFLQRESTKVHAVADGKPVITDRLKERRETYSWTN